MKAVIIDANVYVSSLISPAGIPAKIMGLVHVKKIALLVSYSILDEYASTALYPAIQKLHGYSKKQMEEKIFGLAKVERVITPENSLDVMQDDPDDNKFLECAVEGEADFIVSGDKHLKNLKNYRGIKIVAPIDSCKNNAIVITSQSNVMPVKTGIQSLDSRFRGNVSPSGALHYLCRPQ